ncbi:hypothetical protein H633G_09997 [Metarhizium anisopliae BRIP 53284]|nr:hypothetical protein H633G_09997 [Metarhizium anisopliae BRIP 53284]
MPQSIRSILGKPRVTKPKPRSSSSQTAQSSPVRRKRPPPEPQDDALFPLKFGDLGAAPILTSQEELILRDVPQAMRYIRSRMFSAVPGSGFTSTRLAEVLNYRASMPPLVTAGHVNAVLTSSPGKIERQVAELVGKGVLRRVRVERRGGVGEALIEVGDLEEMLRRAAAQGEISDAAGAKFRQVLQGDAAAQRVERGGGEGDDGLTARQADELVRAGFLTSSTAAPGSTLHVRPEDRTTLTSIQHLADAAVDWVREALGKTKWGEGPESWLKERFEGNGLYGTRWKEFWGVEWEWVLGQAVGLGVVEVFETGSVGKGVRALGG